MNANYNIASQLGLQPYGSAYGLHPSIGNISGSCADYNANNSWYFNGNNGCINNNNRYNTNFRSRPCLDYDPYDNKNFDDYPIPLSLLLSVSRRAEKCKRNKPTYTYFSLHRIEELVLLTHQLNNFELLPREGTAHIIHEPRVRQIVCAHAAERVIQTFYIMVMQPYLERHMYHDDSYSCRPKKGGLRAVKRLIDYIYEETEGYTKDAYVVKRDIQAFFMSVDCFNIHNILIRFIDTYMSEHPYYEHLKYITRFVFLSATKDHIKNMARPEEMTELEPKKNIKNNPYYKGVPIGNWTSQTSGLILTTTPLLYMESLGLKFIHYTDDNTAVVKDKAYWRDCDRRIAQFYETELGLTIHPKKRYMQHYSKGVELLGYKIRFGRILPSNRVHHNIMLYLKRITSLADVGHVLALKDKIRDSINSYLGLLRHISGYKLRREMCRTITQSIVGIVFYAAPDYTKIVIKPKYTTSAYYQRACRKIKHQNIINHESNSKH